MKNWKHWAFAAVIAIFGIIISFTACDNGNTTSSPETFTVSFDTDGGTPQPPDQTIEKNKTATQPPAVSKTNYQFEYWFNTADNAEWVFTTPITANVTLKAKWKEAPKARPGTEKFFRYEMTATDCKVTIKSDDKFLDSDWVELCDKLMVAIEGGFGPGFGSVFAVDQNATVVLINDFSHNWEVKDGEFRTVYIKTASIETINYRDIVEYMDCDFPGFM